MKCDACIVQILSNYQPTQESTCVTEDEFKALRNFMWPFWLTWFLFFHLGLREVFCSWLKKKTPFIQTSVYHQMAIDKNKSFLIFPQHQTTLAGNFWCKSRWKSNMHLSGISSHPMRLHIVAKYQMTFSPDCSCCRNSLLLKTETEVHWNALMSKFSTPKQKHIKEIKSFWIFFHLHILFLQSNTPSCLNLLCDFAWLIHDSVEFGWFFFCFPLAFILACLQKEKDLWDC